MKIKIVKDYSCKKFFVKLVDNNDVVISAETGKTPSELLNKLNFRISNAQNEESLRILTKFKQLVQDVEKKEWFV